MSQERNIYVGLPAYQKEDISLDEYSRRNKAGTLDRTILWEGPFSMEEISAKIHGKQIDPRIYHAKIDNQEFHNISEILNESDLLLLLVRKIAAMDLENPSNHEYAVETVGGWADSQASRQGIAYDTEAYHAFIKTLPAVFQAGRYLDQFILQERNGGVNQYLLNTQMAHMDELLAAMAFVGATEHHAVMSAFLTEANALKAKHATVRENDNWSDFANAFCDTYGDESVQALEAKLDAIQPELEEIAAKFFVAHPELFVGKP